VAGLLADYGVSTCSDPGLDMAGCTGCKSKESSAVARCFDCNNFLCANCVMAHQFMHCFEGHHVTTLGEITSNAGTRGTHHVQELDAVNKVISEAKVKANEIRNNLKNLETTSTRLASQYQKAVSEVNETYQFYVSMLEERRGEVSRELESAYSTKQVALSVYTQKAQETVDKIFQVTDFVERLMKHATNFEVLLFKKPLDARLHQLLAYTPELNLGSITDLEFISNFQAIQVGVKNQFGYVKSKGDAARSAGQQPPISRPIQSPLPHHHGSNSSAAAVAAAMAEHQLLRSFGSNSGPQQLDTAASLLAAAANNSKRFSSSPSQMNHLTSLLNGASLSELTGMGGHGRIGDGSSSSPGLGGGSAAAAVAAAAAASHLSGGGNHMGNMGMSGGLGFNPYEKWSNGGDSLFNLTPHQAQQQEQSFKDRLSQLSQPPNDMVDLTSKFMSGTAMSPSPMRDNLRDVAMRDVGGPLYPPKSQIKRQKMIYHCKFGEFGILEGQFTEPSGVAVNAQNDIIVADTNNHRIQIFDKEGRFKFQFGEVGKRDGQLLYPNRVAVVKTSGDIIVTERSPTHQIQIYNQYGQFVRKFGANILQHPRGVTVDNKGRIIVVECKVMRVIIFDQYGNVLNKFGCSKHLEFPNGVVVNDRQEIFISDNRAHCVKVFDYEGNYLRQIGGEGITNYPIGVGINSAGEITIADNHNNFNLSVFSQDGQLISALESKVKHAQCFDVSLMDDGSVVLASKDYRLYIYRYIQVPPVGI
jgi:tripartite motif-containing protein 2/3